jgi:metal-dependent amidase/aminoacylase/carboxypeptidase family protein
VRLLFQPAEEGAAGAKVMIEDGALGAAQAIFGFHVDPSSPVGVVTSSSWEVVITAQGGHAAFPNRTADPILTASSLILSLQQLVSRETDPLDTAVNFSPSNKLFQSHHLYMNIPTVLLCITFLCRLVALVALRICVQ